MSSTCDAQCCDFCRRGTVVEHAQQVAFRQSTDKGYVFCCVDIPIGVCDHCQAQHWTADAEAIVAEAVRREYEKLPARGV
jgi:hypothetical protein